MNEDAKKALDSLKSYWNHQRQDEIKKTEIKLTTRKELFSKQVDKLTIGAFYQWLLSEGYIMKNPKGK